MGCGESKHAVATQNTITKSKSFKKQDPKDAEIPKNGGNVTANNAVKDSVILKKNEILAPKKTEESEVVKAEEEEVKKEEREEVAAVVEVVHEKKEEIIKDEELKEEKKEEVRTEVEERESAAIIEAVKEREEEKEIKNEVVSQQVEDSSSFSAVMKISEGENNVIKEESKFAVAEKEGNEGKEELDQEIKPSAEEKKPADEKCMNLFLISFRLEFKRHDLLPKSMVFVVDDFAGGCAAVV
ncbi:gelsolin-related protein of 125 kDa-like protein [Salvia divinorum]|uniref:Gelsolin-related protein of 125 kDa-like protein n=1 Tax=Salvia divinorum TaxID=28513 RepID=A0ABD1IKZ6_SALDI